MTKNKAKVKIAGDAAHQVAAEVLNSSGMAPEQIGDVELTLAVDGHEETDITIDASGPKAGSLMHEMVSALDFDQHHVNAVTAELVEQNGHSMALPADDDTVAPPVEVVGSYAGHESVEYPKGTPRRVTPDTNASTTLVEAWHYLIEEQASGVTTPELYEADNEVSSYQMSAGSLAKLFNVYHMVARVRVEDKGGRKYRYLPTAESLEEYIRLEGEPPAELRGKLAAARSGDE
jgi:hypothetical protein